MALTRRIPSLLAIALVALPLTANQDAAQARHAVLTASNQIVVLDGDDYSVLARVPVGRMVLDFASTPDGERVFLATSGGVFGLDPKGWSLAGPYTDRPVQNMRLSPDGKTLFVLDHQIRAEDQARRIPEGFRTVAIDCRTLEVRPFASYSRRVFDAAVAMPGGSLFTLDFEAGALLEMREGQIGPVTETLIAPPGPEGQGLFLRMLPDPLRGRILLPQLGEVSRIWVFQAESRTARAWPMSKEKMPLRGAALSPDGSRLYVVALQQLSALNADDGTEIGTTALDGPFQQVAVSPDGAVVYATAPSYKQGKDDQQGGGLAVIDAASLSVRRVVELAGISPYAVLAVPN